MRRSARIFFLAVGAALMFEALADRHDPLANIGYYVHSNISSWSGVRIIATPIELALGVILAVWLFRDRHTMRERLAWRRGTLWWPLLALMGTVVLALAYGKLQGGDLTIALWEVRGFGMLFVVYILTGIFVREEQHLNLLIWTVFIAATVLAADNILRAVLPMGITFNDLTYDHTDSLVLGFAVVLCWGLLLFGGTRRQRRYAVFLMVLAIVAMEVMKRRAAFGVLAVGAVAFVIMLYRLRPRLFWKLVLPTVVLTSIYLAIFWNNQGLLGQPARAISSLFTPDARDAASNIYRTMEKMNLILNIRSAPVTGLGFGQRFVFYFPLPDESFWPFWHYTPHNAIIWVWLKGGILAFAAFWWLLARTAHDGGRVLETQREKWQLVRTLRRLLASPPSTRPRGPRTEAANPTPRWDVPTWERSDQPRRGTIARSGAVAFLVACVAYVPMQVAYSYVDLGLTSERAMLLLGIVLGVIARGAQLFPPADSPRELVDAATRRAPHLGGPAAGPRARALPPATVSAGAPTEEPREPAGTAPGRTRTTGRPTAPPPPASP